MDTIVGKKHSFRVRIGAHHSPEVSLAKTPLKQLLTPAAFQRLKSEFPDSKNPELRDKVIDNIAGIYNMPNGNLVPGRRTSSYQKLESLVPAALTIYKKVCTKLGVTPPRTTVSCDSRELVNACGKYYLVANHIGVDMDKLPAHPFSTILHELGHVTNRLIKYKFGEGEDKDNLIIFRNGFRFRFAPLLNSGSILCLRGASEFLAESVKLMGLKMLGYQERKQTILPSQVRVIASNRAISRNLNEVQKCLQAIASLLDESIKLTDFINPSHARGFSISKQKRKDLKLQAIYDAYMAMPQVPDNNVQLNLTLDRSRLKNRKVVVAFHMSKPLDHEKLAGGLFSGDLNTAHVIGSSALESRENDTVNSRMSYWTFVETFKKFALEISAQDSTELSKQEKEVSVEKFVKCAYKAQRGQNPRLLIDQLRKICVSKTEMKLMLSYGKAQTHEDYSSTAVEFDALISELWFLVRAIEHPVRREIATHFLLNLNMMGSKDTHIEMKYLTPSSPPIF